MGICLSKRTNLRRENLRKSNRVHDVTSSRNEPFSSSHENKEQMFQFSREIAEDMLKNADCGVYLLSHDITSELFISVSNGNYVSHHAISKRTDGVVSIGGEKFNSTEEMLDFFKSHVIGSTTLSFELTSSDNSVKKETSKGSRSKSENSSWQLHTISSFEHTSDQLYTTDMKYGKIEEYDTSKRNEIKPVKEEKRQESENIVKIPQVNADPSSIQQTVSSAGEMDLPIDEPLPVLPEPTGRRPPPLAPFSEAHFRSIFNSTEVNQIIKFLLPKECAWTPYLSTKMIKLIICGTSDTQNERDHFMREFMPRLLDFCYQYGFQCDVTHIQVSPNGTTNNEWEVETDSMFLSKVESNYLKQFSIPVVAVVFTSNNSVGNKLGSPTVPRRFTKEDFTKATKVLSGEQQGNLSHFYSVDYNDLNHSHVINNDVISDSERMRNLEEICLKLLAKCFEGEDDLWTCFAPELERNLELMMKNFGELEIVLVEKQSDIRETNSTALRSSKEYHDNNHDGNLDYRLRQKESNCILKLKEQGTIKENEILYLNSASGDKVDENVASLVEKKLMKIMLSFPAERFINRRLDEEICSHLVECHTNLRLSFPHFDVLNTVKAYIEGPFRKPLVLFGGSACVQSYVIAKTTQLAIDWFGDNACIVTRLVATTEDSTSLRLLLRSICLQISLAYNTDPTSVPQDLSELVQFLPSVFRFATDSQPLVICIAGLTEIEAYDKEFECFHLITNQLCDHVKIVTTINDQHLPQAKEIYKDKNSFKQINEESSQNALEMIDKFLISADRTISDSQKKTISDLVTRCYSPVFVKLLSEEIEKLQSFDELKFAAEGSLKDYLSSLFHEAENKFGKEMVTIFCSLVTSSKFGVSKRCLWHVLSQEVAEGVETRGLDEKINGILRYLQSIIKLTWMNEMLVVTWFDPCISDVVKERYVSDSNVCDRVVIRVIGFFTKDPNKFNIIWSDQSSKSNHLKSLDQPISNHSNHLITNHRKSLKHSTHVAYNLEKLRSFPYFLAMSKNIDNLKKHTLCNFGFLYDKLRAFSVSHLLNDFTVALSQFPEDLDLKIVMEFFELATDALKFDAEQFPAQVIARMLPVSGASHAESIKANVDDDLGGIKDRQIDIESNPGPIVDKSTEDGTEKGLEEANGTDKPNDNPFSSQSIYLTELANAALKNGHNLMPSKTCFVRPPSDCGVFAQNQISSFWLKNDMRILFIGKRPDKFIAWSAQKETIMLYDWRCNILRTHRGVKLRRALLALDTSIVIEMHDRSCRIYDVMNGEYIATMDSNLSYFAVCDLAHVAAMSSESTRLNVYNVRSCEVVWEFNAPNGRRFHNVVISRNGEIGACILEASTSSDSDVKSKQNSENQIIVLNLKERRHLHAINLDRNQLFNELCAISEDGRYLAYLSETGSHFLLLDLIKGTLLHEIEVRLHRVLKMLVSSQGNCVLTVSADSVLRLWNLNNGDIRFNLSEPISSIRGGYMDDTHCLSMSEDGSRAVHSLNSRFHCSYVVLWDLIAGIRLATLTSDFYGLSYEISPDGKYVISCMPSGLVTLCSADSDHYNVED